MSNKIKNNETSKSSVKWLTDQLPLRVQNMYSEVIQEALRLEVNQHIQVWNNGYNGCLSDFYKDKYGV